MLSGLAAGVGNTPMKVPGWPLKVTISSGSSDASSIRATSRSRTTASPSAESGKAPNASGVCSVVCIWMLYATNSFSVRPGAARKFEALIAACTSAAVTPRAASCSGSIQTRIA